ncbi:MAG: DedA family protein [Patescibacteria group bacterium]|jgi:undecaprenyl-diphosphatase
MNDVAGIFLEAFSRFGLFGLWFMVAFEAFEFVASIPIGPIIILVGSLASQGVVSIVALWLTVYSAVVAGDNVGFLVGRKFGRPILYKFGTKIIKQQAIEKADKAFVKYGTIAIFFTRFIFATIAAPLNVIAGASGLAWKKYLPAEMSGQLVWTSIYTLAGYFFGRQVEKFIRLIDQANLIGAVLVLTLTLIIFAFLVYRPIRHHLRNSKK